MTTPPTPTQAKTREEWRARILKFKLSVIELAMEKCSTHEKSEMQGAVLDMQTEILDAIMSLQASVTRLQAENQELRAEAERLRGIGQDELDRRFDELKSTNLVVGSLCKSKGYGLHGLLKDFANRPDLHKQVLDELEVKQMTLFIDEKARQPK